MSLPARKISIFEDPDTGDFRVLVGTHQPDIGDTLARVLNCACHVPPDSHGVAKEDEVRTVGVARLLHMCRLNDGPKSPGALNQQLSILLKLCKCDIAINSRVIVGTSRPHRGGKTLVILGEVGDLCPLKSLPRYSPPVALEDMLAVYAPGGVPEAGNSDPHWVELEEAQVKGHDRSGSVPPTVAWQAWRVAHALARRRMVWLRRGDVQLAKPALRRAKAMLKYVDPDYHHSVDLVLLVGEALLALITDAKPVAAQYATEVLLTPTANPFVVANAHLVLAHTVFSGAKAAGASNTRQRAAQAEQIAAVAALLNRSTDHAQQALSIAWAIKDYDTALEAVACLANLELASWSTSTEARREQLLDCAQSLAEKVTQAHERITLRAPLVKAMFLTREEDVEGAGKALLECEEIARKHGKEVGTYQRLQLRRAQLDLKVLKARKGIHRCESRDFLESIGAALIEDWERNYGPSRTLRTQLTAKLDRLLIGLKK